MQFAQMFTLLGAPFAQPPMQRQFSGQQQDAAHQGNGSVDVQGADARAGPSGPGPRGTNIRVVRAAGRNPYMEGLLNYFLSRLGGDVNMHGLPAVNMFQLHGNPADYAWGAGGLDAIITQLLNQLESSGPPPADRDKITALPTVAISQEQVDRTLQCSVCMEYFTLEEDVKKLPCDHHYHEPCIVPWLEMHGTCPVCRKDLNGHDTTTEVPPVPDLAAAAAQNGAPSSRSSTSNTSSDTNPSLD